MFADMLAPEGRSDDELVERVLRDVYLQIGEVVPEEVLRAEARVALSQLEDARILTFVPMFAAGDVIAKLRHGEQN